MSVVGQPQKGKGLSQHTFWLMEKRSDAIWIPSTLILLWRFHQLLFVIKKS